MPSTNVSSNILVCEHFAWLKCWKKIWLFCLGKCSLLKNNSFARTQIKHQSQLFQKAPLNFISRELVGQKKISELLIRTCCHKYKSLWWRWQLKTTKSIFSHLCDQINYDYSFYFLDVHRNQLWLNCLALRSERVQRDCMLAVSLVRRV